MHPESEFLRIALFSAQTLRSAFLISTSCSLDDWNMGQELTAAPTSDIKLVINVSDEGRRQGPLRSHLLSITRTKAKYDSYRIICSSPQGIITIALTDEALSAVCFCAKARIVALRFKLLASEFCHWWKKHVFWDIIYTHQ